MPAPPPGLPTTPRPRAGPGHTAALRGRHTEPRGMWGTHEDTRGHGGDTKGPRGSVAGPGRAHTRCCGNRAGTAVCATVGRLPELRHTAPEVPPACPRPGPSAPGLSRHRHCHCHRHRHHGETALQGPLLHQPLPRQHQSRYERGRGSGRAGSNRAGPRLMFSCLRRSHQGRGGEQHAGPSDHPAPQHVPAEGAEVRAVVAWPRSRDRPGTGDKRARSGSVSLFSVIL